VKRGPKISAHVDVAAHPDLMRGLMQSVVAFMARTGMSDAAIRNVFLKCVSRPKLHVESRKSTPGPSFEYGRDTVAGAVLRAWHKTPKYLTSDARPVGLRVNGREPNMTSLILSQDRRADVKAVIRSMVNAGLLRQNRSKSYFPEKDAATIESLDPLAVDHIAKTVMRLVETATRNVAKSRDKLQLIERYAHVPDLTMSQARAFAAFSRQQGQACLDAVEDWMESRQTTRADTTKKPRNGVSAGVHIFAYLGEPAPTKNEITSTASKKRRKTTSEARA
jgi:hypothetical protein